MLGIISCGKTAGPENWNLPSQEALPREFFQGGFFSVNAAEESDSFIAKDGSGNKIIIFQGRLYAGNGRLEPQFDKDRISEIIFSLSSEKGEEFLKDLKGEFILGLWDKDANKFLLARDKLGVKNIYYSVKNGSLMFSTGIKDFFKYAFTEKDIDLEALNLYFTYRFVPSPYTVFRDIFKVPSACAVILENGRLGSKKYWHFDIERATERRDIEEDAKEVERLIRSSIERRVPRTANVCAYLSGGTDSSTIAGLAAGFKGNNLFAFCARNDVNYHDSEYARLVAGHFKLNYFEKTVSWADVANHFPRTTRILEEPIADPSGIYLSLINGLARNYGDTILSGEGGDVLFGGHRFCYLLALAGKFSFICPSALFDLLSRFNFSPSLKYRFLSLRDSKDAAMSFLDILGSFPKDGKEALFTDRMRKVSRDDLDLEIAGAYFKKGSHLLDSLTRLLMENHVADMFLARANKLAKADSIGHIAPFLDEDLAGYVFGIPKSNIFNMGNRKIILKKILEGLGLSRKAVHRKKVGLTFPAGEWMDKGLESWLRNLLNYKTLCGQGFFNFRQVEKIIRSSRNDLRAQWQLWSIVTFTLWHKIFISEETVT